MIAQFVAVVLPILICTGIGFAWSRSAGPVDPRALVFLVASVGFPCLLLSSLDRPGLSIGMVAGAVQRRQQQAGKADVGHQEHQRAG
ncbi:hypothetical protein, partial [Klebsiella pneumoniae]|uniref:hypothetical protein n=1 Tax=Klebsiella pneumoniae TaxID=573 RepID=UPI001C1FC25B